MPGGNTILFTGQAGTRVVPALNRLRRHLGSDGRILCLEDLIIRGPQAKDVSSFVGLPQHIQSALWSDAITEASGLISELPADGLPNFQVKSGHVSVHQVRDLCHVVEREKAVMGVFLSLKSPTFPMKKEATGFGFYTPDHYPDRKYPRMQLLTVEELLSRAKVQYPETLAPQATFKKAAPKKKAQKAVDQSHPEAMFENGLLTDE